MLRGIKPFADITPSSISNLFTADFKMPDMSGKQLLSEIKERYRHMAGKMVSLTRDKVSRHTRAFLQRSDCSHPTKSFELDETGRLGPSKIG